MSKWDRFMMWATLGVLIALVFFLFTVSPDKDSGKNIKLDCTVIED